MMLNISNNNNKKPEILTIIKYYSQTKINKIKQNQQKASNSLRPALEWSQNLTYH